jgi:hypothetical protein
VLADEINRATPKTQSALLEAMQEQSVTVAKKTYKLDQPFFVLATQNPLEMEGTYPLPEAQLDRFLFKLHVRFPGREELHTILDRTTGGEDAEVKPCSGATASSRSARSRGRCPSRGTCRTSPCASSSRPTPTGRGHRDGEALRALRGLAPRRAVRAPGGEDPRADGRALTPRAPTTCGERARRCATG